MMQLSLDIRKQDHSQIFLDRSTKKGLPEYHPEKQKTKCKCMITSLFQNQEFKSYEITIDK